MRSKCKPIPPKPLILCVGDIAYELTSRILILTLSPNTNQNNQNKKMAEFVENSTVKQADEILDDEALAEEVMHSIYYVKIVKTAYESENVIFFIRVSVNQ